MRTSVISPPWLQGDVLGGGKYTSQVRWKPRLNGRQLLVTTSSKFSLIPHSDSDAGNDAQTIEVSVENWYDIQVDLSWDSGKVAESGAGVKAWTLSVIANGSDTFNPREVVHPPQGSGDCHRST